MTGWPHLAADELHHLVWTCPDDLLPELLHVPDVLAHTDPGVLLRALLARDDDPGREWAHLLAAAGLPDPTTTDRSRRQRLVVVASGLPAHVGPRSAGVLAARVGPGEPDELVPRWSTVPPAPSAAEVLLTGHSLRVVSLCAVPLSGGRTLLASVAADGEVRRWDPLTGTPFGEPFDCHARRAATTRAVPLPDGRTLLATAGGEDRTVRLWDPLTGRPPHGDPLTGPLDVVEAVCAVPLPEEGRALLASVGGEDRTVRLWHPATGARHGSPLAGHADGVRAVCAVPLRDGSTVLATAGRDRTVRLWDPRTGAAHGVPLSGHTDWVAAVCALPRPDGGALLASAGDDGTVRVWDPGADDPGGEPLAGCGGPVSALCAVPQPDGGALLAVVHGEEVRAYPHPPRAAAVRVAPVPLPDGRLLLATAGGAATVQLWDPRSGTPHGDLLVDHGDEAVTVVSLSDSRTRPTPADREWGVRLRDVRRTGVREELPTGHTGRVTALCAVPLADGRTLLASAGLDRVVRLWDLRTGSPYRELPTGVTAEPCAVCPVTLPDGRTLVAQVCVNGTTTLWDTATGARTTEPRVGRVDWTRSVPLPDGRTMIAHTDEHGTTTLNDPHLPPFSTFDTFDTVPTVGGRFDSVQVLCTVPVPDRRPLLVCVDRHGAVTLWHGDVPTPAGRPMTGHSGRVSAACAVPLPDGPVLLATTGGDRTVRLWEPDTGRQRALLHLPEPGTALAALPGGAVAVGHGSRIAVLDGPAP